MDKPYIYCRDAEKVYEVYGIPQSRAQKLHEIMDGIAKKWEGKTWKVSVILNEVWDYCNTREETTYVTYLLGLSVGQAEGRAQGIMVINPPAFNQQINNN